MAHTRLIVHVAEPFDFARYNGGESDIRGWTAQATPAFPYWVLHLDRPARLGEESFEKVRLSARYVGETLVKVFDGFGFTAVNISHPRIDEDGRAYWHFAMVGNVLLEPMDG
ncbi:hypothetical protein [Sphingomonas morindae]|uniref:Phage tail protein n=1 Tax=Sphingomonas morindae TaxID=1541170 RepID=A0ABY4X5C1_9SPHN|nr:hypothetical protein [Sphingomonas morindae]USI72078.1 hypothetical protein LHA26_12285 [Sphingomonas morindae]